jgi:hypothetical protein
MWRIRAAATTPTVHEQVARNEDVGHKEQRVDLVVRLPSERHERVRTMWRNARILTIAANMMSGNWTDPAISVNVCAPKGGKERPRGALRAPA